MRALGAAPVATTGCLLLGLTVAPVDPHPLTEAHTTSAAAAATLTFHPPVVIATGKGRSGGGFWGLRREPSAAVVGNIGIDKGDPSLEAWGWASDDKGSSWKPAWRNFSLGWGTGYNGQGELASFGGGQPDPGALLAEPTRDPFANYTALHGSRSYVVRGTAGLPVVAAVDRPVSVTGLPRPASCGPKGSLVGVCPLQLMPGHTALPDGSLLRLGLASFARSNWPHSTIALRSTDGGYNWRYLSTVAAAEDFPWAHEGPGEAAVALLSDNRTLLAVVRVDGGDGGCDRAELERHGVCKEEASSARPVRDAVQLISHDFGRTWGDARNLTGFGAAGPKLLRLGKRLLLVLGRQASPDGVGAGTDVRLFVSERGDATDWRAHSVSAAHNSLAARGVPRFTGHINASGHPRECGGEAGLVAVSATEALVTYDRGELCYPIGQDGCKSVEPSVFAMRVQFAE